MSKTVINFGTAQIDMELFEAYQKKAMQCLQDAHKLTADAKEFKLDFAEHVEAVAKATGLPKKEVSAFWQARFKESLPKDKETEKETKLIIERGELFSTLNSALEG